MLRPTVNQPVRRDVRRPSGAHDQICITVSCGFANVGALSDERTGLWFTTAAGPRQCSYSRVRVRRTHDHILLSQIWDSPIMVGQVPVFISPRNMVAQLYLQPLDSCTITE
jgi:hypothetical protein